MGRIIVFIAGIFVLAVVIFTLYTVWGIISERLREGDERKQEKERRAREAAMFEQQEQIAQGKVDHEVDLAECPKCSKRSYCRKYQDYISQMAEEQTWFSVLYPTLSNDDGHAVSDAVANLIDSASKEVIARKTAAKLPKNYRDTLTQIEERMNQIRERTDNSSINNVLASYCDSIEKSTLSYVELLDAPVQSAAMRKTMAEIESAIGEVPATLDAILASTYENDSMKALIEAGALRAVIEHNHTMFGGDGNFVADEVSRIFGVDTPVETDDLDDDEELLFDVEKLEMVDKPKKKSKKDGGLKIDPSKMSREDEFKAKRQSR